MKIRHWGAGIVGLLLVLLSIWQILAAAQGLEITTIRPTTPARSTTPPLTIITLEGERDRPLVLIAHGIASSSVIMRGFGLSLAHAGYTAVLWNFDGHGDNPQPFSSSTPDDALMRNAETALAEALAHGFGDPGRIAILGHSMGSGVALSYGQEHPETAATIAVSPTGQPVTPELPHNLLLMAGSLEAPFLRNAEERLAEAGGPGGDPAAGTARKLVIIPSVEHVSILFAPSAHAAARDWLDATFGPQPGAMPYTDRRMIWYGLGLVGVLLLAAALAPLAADPYTPGTPDRPLWWRLAALAGSALGATLVLWLTSRAGLELHSLLNLVVGGYLFIWLGLAGFFALPLLRIRPSSLSRRTFLGGLLVFATLWLGLGLLGQLVWLPWLLIPQRLLLWPLGMLLLLPWFLMVGTAARNTGFAGRVGWWLGHSAIVVGALFLTLQLNPELGFLTLILPLFPIILAFHALATAPHRGSWPFALSGALFTSWLLLAVFPLL